MRLGLLTLLWKRHELANIVLSYYNQLDIEGVTLVKHAVGSEGQPSRRVAETNGWHYTEHPNQPFTDKWNAAMEPFREWDVGGVVIIGSDNLHNGTYFSHVADMFGAGVDSIRLGACHMYDIPTGRMFRYSNTTIGTGRALSASLLDQVGWRPWRPGFRRNADGHLNNNIWPWERRVALIKTPHKAGMQEVGLKSGEDMHTFDGVRKGLDTTPIDSSRYFKRWFPGVKPRLDSLPLRK